MSTRPKRTGTHKFSDGIKWIQGNADLEITEDPSDMSWINEAERFADAVAGAFVTNNPENRAMLQAFLKRVAEVIEEMI